MSEALLEANIARAEAALEQRLLAQDVAAVQQWLSPSLFFTDQAGQWLGVHPCMAAWSAQRVQITALRQGAVEYLLCGQLALVSSDVQLGCAGADGEQRHTLRLLRVWASCSAPAGVHLLSVGVLPARGG